MDPVAVLFGGPSPEHDISILTGLLAGRVLREHGQRVVHIYWSPEAKFFLVPDDLEAAEFLEPRVRSAEDVVFDAAAGFVKRTRLSVRAVEVTVVLNCCHGGPGEDGTLSGMLAVAGVRVTGPKASACALAMDKLATAAIAERLGIPTIPTTLITETTTVIPHASPWIIKPRYGGSSLGVEANVGDLETVRVLAKQGSARSGAIVQPYLDGWQDINVAVRTYPDLELSAIERPLRQPGRIYDYSDKYLAGGGGGLQSAPRELPAVVPDAITKQVRQAASAIAVEMQLDGLPRIDFLWDPEQDELLLCEVNAIPGALGLYLWEAAGHSKSEMLMTVIEEALRGPAQPAHWHPTSDHAALRAAGTIAAKLA